MPSCQRWRDVRPCSNHRWVKYYYGTISTSFKRTSMQKGPQEAWCIKALDDRQLSICTGADYNTSLRSSLVRETSRLRAVRQEGSNNAGRHNLTAVLGAVVPAIGSSRTAGVLALSPTAKSAKLGVVAELRSPARPARPRRARRRRRVLRGHHDRTTTKVTTYHLGQSPQIPRSVTCEQLTARRLLVPPFC